jgi:hypothetical protein
MAYPALPAELLPVRATLQGQITSTLALGLLASGGSGLWNSVLTYVLQVQDLKEELAKTAETRTKAIKKVADSVVEGQSLEANLNTLRALDLLDKTVLLQEKSAQA